MAEQYVLDAGELSWLKINYPDRYSSYVEGHESGAWMCTCASKQAKPGQLLRAPEGALIFDHYDHARSCWVCEAPSPVGKKEEEPKVVQRFLNRDERIYAHKRGGMVNDSTWLCTHAPGFFSAEDNGCSIDAYINNGHHCMCRASAPSKNDFPRAVLLNEEEREIAKRYGSNYTEEGIWMCVGHDTYDLKPGELKRFPEHGAIVFQSKHKVCHCCGNPKPTPEDSNAVSGEAMTKKDECCGYGNGNPEGPSHHTFCKKWKKLDLSTPIHECKGFLVGMELIIAGCPDCKTTKVAYCPRCHICTECDLKNDGSGEDTDFLANSDYI